MVTAMIENKYMWKGIAKASVIKNCLIWNYITLINYYELPLKRFSHKLTGSILLIFFCFFLTTTALLLPGFGAFFFVLCSSASSEGCCPLGCAYTSLNSLLLVCKYTQGLHLQLMFPTTATTETHLHHVKDNVFAFHAIHELTLVQEVSYFPSLVLVCHHLAYKD